MRAPWWKIVFGVLALLLVVSLVYAYQVYSDLQNTPYRLTVEDGCYYINLGPRDVTWEDYPGDYIFWIDYGTVEEMFETIRNGSFDERWLDKMYLMLGQKFPTVNLSEFYVISGPDDYDTITAAGFGAAYSTYVSIEDQYRATAYSDSQESLEENINRLENNGVGTDYYSKITTVEDRNAKEFYSKKGSTYKKESIYKIIGDNGTYYVHEFYQITILDDDLTDDECYDRIPTVPSVIELYGTSLGQPFKISITPGFEMKERPSVEWLAAFGLKEYKS